MSSVRLAAIVHIPQREIQEVIGTVPEGCCIMIVHSIVGTAHLSDCLGIIETKVNVS